MTRIKEILTELDRLAERISFYSWAKKRLILNNWKSLIDRVIQKLDSRAQELVEELQGLQQKGAEL